MSKDQIKFDESEAPKHFAKKFNKDAASKIKNPEDLKIFESDFNE